LFSIKYQDRLNASQIIQNPYFDNLKDHIIYERVFLVDPYLLCLYEFENGEIQRALEYIDFCINDLIQTKNNCEEYLKKFIILKLKVLLYSERIEEFNNYSQSFASNLGNLINVIWNDPNFYLSYQSLMVEYNCLYNFSSIKEDKMSQLFQYQTKCEKYLNYDSKILFNLCLGIYYYKLNNNDCLKYILEARKLYMDEEISDNVQGTIQFSRMNFILGTIYKQQGYSQQNLSHIEQAYTYLYNAIFLHPNKQPFKPSIDLLKAMINYFNLLKGVAHINPKYKENYIELINRSLEIFTKAEKEENPLESTKLINLVFKYKLLLIQAFLSWNNNELAKKIFNSPYISFKDYDCDPKLLNQLAFLLYELNEIEESERIIIKGLKLAEAQNSNKEIMTILQMNYCLLLYIHGDYSTCKNIINDLHFDLKQKYEIIKDSLYEMVVKNICFFKGFFGDTQYLTQIKINSNRKFPNENNLSLLLSFKYDFFNSYIRNRNFKKAAEIVKEMNQCIIGLNNQKDPLYDLSNFYYLFADFILTFYEQNANSISKNDIVLNLMKQMKLKLHEQYIICFNSALNFLIESDFTRTSKWIDWFEKNTQFIIDKGVRQSLLLMSKLIQFKLH